MWGRKPQQAAAHTILILHLEVNNSTWRELISTTMHQSEHPRISSPQRNLFFGL